jgi:hypothetical protein
LQKFAVELDKLVKEKILPTAATAVKTFTQTLLSSVDYINEKLGIKLAKPLPLRDFNIDAIEVRRIMQKRYGNQIPYDEPMVAPSQLFESQLLENLK